MISEGGVTLKKGLSGFLAATLLFGSLSGTVSAEAAGNESFGQSLPIVNVQATDLLPAFPGAEGGGKYVTGGRGGEVYEVTTLADSGPGSLREGVSRSNTTVVFRVGGTIHLESPLSITGTNVTIAGQTAPGEGITVSDYWTSFRADNVIVRHLRFRLGDRFPSEDDAFGGRYYKNIMIDHCSFSWSVDEVLSMYENENTTVQWSIVSESMLMTTHQKGRHGYAGIWGGNNASFHHNLIAHNVSRNPRLAGAPGYLLEMYNNVVYNWGFFSAYGGEQGNYNLINNYFKPGPNTYGNARSMLFLDVAPETRLYADGNMMDGDPAVTADNWSGIGTLADPASRLSSPVVMPNGTGSSVEAADVAYDRVLAEAGATLPRRDAVDARIVHETSSGTGKHINSQKEVGGYPEFAETSSTLADSDQDGMPDEWELANGLDPHDASDRNALHASGYTQLEMYLNGIAGEGFANPETSILSPADHVLLNEGDSLEISASASDIDGTIAKVEFYAGDIKLGEDDTAPYAFEWTNVPEGTHFLTVRAVDDSGTSTQSSSVSVHANREGNISPWQSTDIGMPGIAGHTELGASASDVVVKSSGDIAGGQDHFHFAHQMIEGNGEVVARIEQVTATDDGAEAGVMIRESLDADSPFVGLFIPYVKGGQKYMGLTRSGKGENLIVKEPEALTQTPNWVKIVRLGDTFTSLTSSDGENWQAFDTVTLPLANTLYFGLAADASKPDDLVDKYNASTFSNASVNEFDDDYPSAPSGLTASAGDKSVELSWDAVGTADRYNVLRSLIAGGPYETVASGVEETQYVDTNLTVGRTYYYTVTSQNGSGISYRSGEVSAIPTGEPETIFLVDDDFEAAAPGSTPEGYIVTPNPQDADHQVVVSEIPSAMTGNDSSQALKVYDNASGNTSFFKAFAPQKGSVIVEADISSPGWPGTSAVLSLQNAAGNRSPLTIELRVPSLPTPQSGYTLTYKVNGADHKLTAPPSNNQWYTFKVVANVPARTADIYVNDALSAEDVPFQSDVSADGIGRISAKTPGGGKGTLYYDNIKVYVEPVESPKGLLSVPGNGKVRLDWQAAEGAVSYRVQRSETDGGPYEAIASDLTVPTYIDETAANGATYYYVVTAVGPTGESGVSNQTSASPSEHAVKPEAPSGVTAEARNAQADLTWQAVPYATHYTVKRAAQPNGPFVPIASELTERSYREGGLTNGTPYYYVISATSVAGEGEDSEPVALTPIAHLTAPVLTAQAGIGEARVEWEPVPGAEAYDVEKASNPEGPYTLLAPSVADNAYADSDLAYGDGYYYAVTAVAGNSRSLRSVPAFVRALADNGTPGAPADPTATPGDESVSLRWGAVPEADHYALKRSSSPEGPFETVTQQVYDVQAIDSGLANGQRYYYVVTASNAEGEGIASTIVSEIPGPVITVSSDGSADYGSVQSAIDAVPEGRSFQTIIKIAAGTYREKLLVPAGTSPIRMIGAGRDDTVLVYGDSASTIGPDGTPLGTSGSYSFRVLANDFAAEHLTIRNDAGQNAGQAVALYAQGDRLTFRDVALRGWQDTLYANGGRQYYADSHIEGSVDFIFGGASAVFENSVIHSLGGGYVTAASTPENGHGYVFVNSRLTAEPGLAGQVSLGRPWRAYAQVAYLNTDMGDHIRADGWNNWNNPDNEKTARYGEFASYGPGANPQQRASWAKQLTTEEAEALLPQNVLGGQDGWNPSGYGLGGVWNSQ